MNKWLKLALNSFVGIIMLNLLFSILFGGSVGFLTLAGLFALMVKVLYLLLIVGLVVGIIVAAKDFVFRD